MPITLPKIDDRRYDDLVAEALARIPVHTPEWTNFNQSDPGVTLISVFAFLTESLLYRANLIPERMRKKFLQLLRIPLRDATAAGGLVTISNDAPSASPQPLLLHDGVDVRAGQVPFRTTDALDVLPVEGRLYVKKKIDAPSADLIAYYQQLYASYRGAVPDFPIELYETTPFPSRDGAPLSLRDSTTDQSFWLAILVREGDADLVTPKQLRKAIENRTLTMGVVPSVSAAEATLPAGRPFGSKSTLVFNAFVPKVGANGGLPTSGARVPDYQPIPTRSDVDVFTVAGTFDVSLPAESAMQLWNNLDPLEPGVDALPPQIDDDKVAARLVTWIRLTPSATTSASFTWMGINAVGITQRASVSGELLPQGTGEPDQVARLALAPVLSDSVSITVAAPPAGTPVPWMPIDDLAVAPPEVPLPDPTRPATGARAASSPNVFLLNAESGEVRFGDGVHGARPPAGAILRASYDYALGAEGNVGAGAIDSSPSLPSGFSVTNPLATWGGADAESVAEGEKQISRYVQHHNRAVIAGDFEALTLRTPGVDVARVDVLPNFYPGRGEAPGVVTLMLVPSSDPEQPDAPLPRAPFIDAICRYLDPRRLVTTEIVLRGPDYQGIWISLGVKVEAGFNETQVLEAVKQDVVAFLAPFTSGGRQELADADPVVLGSATRKPNGWKLGNGVNKLELLAVANRTRGVEFARDDVILADRAGTLRDTIPMTGLQLPRILGIRVTNGPAAPLGDVMGGASSGVGGGSPGGSAGGGTGGAGTGGSDTQAPRAVKIPAIPEECRC